MPPNSLRQPRLSETVMSHTGEEGGGGGGEVGGEGSEGGGEGGEGGDTSPGQLQPAQSKPYKLLTSVAQSRLLEAQAASQQVSTPLSEYSLVHALHTSDRVRPSCAASVTSSPLCKYTGHSFIVASGPA